MDTKILQRFRENLSQQRQNLRDWFNSSPAHKKQMRLGPVDAQAAQAHLQVLDSALAKADDKTLGLCQVCHGDIETGRLEMDFTACVCIDHYSAEQRRRLESELELSHKLQKALLPQQVPEIPGLQIAAFSQPAEIVGGDYFDFFRFRDDTFGVAIADVMGKGLPASMLMASLQASLRIIGPESDSPAAVVQRLNGLFCHNIQLIKFISLFLGSYDPATRTLKYCNAGHNPPLLFRRDEHSAKWLQPTGAAIGLAESFVFKLESVTVLPGDILLLYTDGVTETMNAAREEFGENRLVEFVQQQAALPPQEFIKELRRVLNEFAGGQNRHDDVTILLGKMEY